jgi:hypothetical protein
MLFTHKIEGFPRYLISQDGYILRDFYVTHDLKNKDARFIDFCKNNRIYLYSNTIEWRPTIGKLRK